jgi:antitoxin MazE
LTTNTGYGIFFVDTQRRCSVETRVKKWGNSLALRIPKPLAEEVGLYDDSPVELSLVDGKLVITPGIKVKVKLADLLAQVTEENLHSEVEIGPAVGGEVW